MLAACPSVVPVSITATFLAKLLGRRRGLCHIGCAVKIRRMLIRPSVVGAIVPLRCANAVIGGNPRRNINNQPCKWVFML
jgi:hypothetical protein